MDDQLQKVRRAASELRLLQRTIADLEERLLDSKRELKDLQREQLPDLMDMAGVDRIGLAAADNLPACDVVLSPFYHANISAQWTPERQQAALNALTEAGHDDLIKTQIHIMLPRGEHELAAKILDTLHNHYGVQAEIKETVHYSTLTAFVREQFEAGNPLPPLDVIGADIGRIAKLLERKNV